MGFVSIMDGILQNKNYKLYYNTIYYHNFFFITKFSQVVKSFIYENEIMKY